MFLKFVKGKMLNSTKYATCLNRCYPLTGMLKDLVQGFYLQLTLALLKGLNHRLGSGALEAYLAENSDVASNTAVWFFRLFKAHSNSFAVLQVLHCYAMGILFLSLSSLR